MEKEYKVFVDKVGNWDEMEAGLVPGWFNYRDDCFAASGEFRKGSFRNSEHPHTTGVRKIFILIEPKGWFKRMIGEGLTKANYWELLTFVREHPEVLLDESLILAMDSWEIRYLGHGDEHPVEGCPGIERERVHSISGMFPSNAKLLMVKEDEL